MEKRDNINYEELYPTAIERPANDNGETFPQAVPVEWNGNIENSYPQVVPPTEHKTADARYPIAVENKTLYNTPPPFPGTPPFKNGAGNEDTLPPRPRKILGMKKRTLVVICAVVVVIIIGAVVGGVVGSNNSSNSSSNGGSNQSSSSPTQTNSATSTSPILTSATALGIATATLSGTIPSNSAINIHAIAASITIGGDLNFTSISYQNTSSWEISYRFNSGNGTYSKPKIMSLPYTPIEQTPLATTSNTEDLGITINVFYINNAFQITNVNITCPFSTSYNCFIRNVSEISTSLTTKISQQSSLAAEYLGSEFGWRVFYLDENDMVSMISGDAGWDEGVVVGGQGLVGSQVTSLLDGDGDGMMVFYVGGDGVIEGVVWDGDTWSSASQFSSIPPPKFLGSSGALAASSTDTTNRLYYLGTDKQIYEYISEGGLGANWTNEPDQSNQWVRNDGNEGRIAVVGWGDSVRIFYQVGGEVVVSSLVGGRWVGIEGV